MDGCFLINVGSTADYDRRMSWRKYYFTAAKTMASVTFSSLKLVLDLHLYFGAMEDLLLFYTFFTPTYPSGPKGWPIIGNLLESPKEEAWTVLTHLSKEYRASRFS
jgi:hypothetical protein